MKGTLFSADFVKDSDENLRLLELNTDTGFITNTLPTRFDFAGFISILSSNSITELIIVYKSIQTEFVDLLTSTIATDATFITTVTKQKETSSTIYPTAPTDSAEKFILRLAYDENALFDSTYCKQRTNVQKLFYDNSATGSIPEFYYSGSDYTVNTLRSNINDHSTLPDFVVKGKSEEHLPLSFIKLGNSDSSSADRITDFIDNYNYSETKTVEKYHFIASDITDNSKVSGIRTIGIVYGTDIELVTIGQWRVESFLEIPTASEIDYITDDENDSFERRYHDKHYYQLTSNWLRLVEGDGFYLNSSVINPDNTTSAIQSYEVDDRVKSFFLNGLPDGDDTDIYSSWSSSGRTLPTGSYVTSSVVQSLSELDINNSYGILGELQVSENESIYSTVGKHYLVYNTGSDEMNFKSLYDIESTKDFLIDASGSLIPITSNKLIIIENTVTGSLYKLDVEETDTYFVSSSVAPFIVHNSPCFAAGTQISVTSEDVTKNIEDVKVGDVVWSWNHTTNETEAKTVNELISREDIDTITYFLSNGEKLQATLDHPLYIKELNDYASFNPAQTLNDYGLIVKQIEVGHTLQHFDYETLPNADVTINSIEASGKITVYNLKEVADNNNFYANGILVHNRAGGGCCFVSGTKISLSNGDEKDIEDIVVGDEVIGWKEGERSNSVVVSLKPTILANRKLHTINDLQTQFTDEHPFLTQGGWKSIKPDEGTEYGILKVGDTINCCGEWVEIQTLNELEGEGYHQSVYNFTVKDINSYIADGIIVHNK